MDIRCFKRIHEKASGIDYWPEYQVSLINRVDYVNQRRRLSKLKQRRLRVLPPQNILLNTDENARFVIGSMF